MHRPDFRRIASVAAAIAALTLAACSSPTGPSHDSPDGGVYGGSGTRGSQVCEDGGVYGGSGTCQ